MPDKFSINHPHAGSVYAAGGKLPAMRTGRLSISRGHELGERTLRAPAEPAPARNPAPVSFVPSRGRGDLDLINVRINALERLTRLVEQGALSMDEFKLEKSLILRLTGDELLLSEKAPAAERGPSLLARMRAGRIAALLLVGGCAVFLADAAALIGA